MTHTHQDSLNLRQLFEPVVGAMGYELVGVECTGIGHGGKLRVYVDKQGGITIDDCQKVSYQLSGLLDVEDPIHGNYTLEISSPGLDRPLFQAQDFDRFAGELARIRLDAPLNGQRKYVGKLHGMQGDNVVIEVDGNELRVPLSHIARARLVPKC